MIKLELTRREATMILGSLYLSLYQNKGNEEYVKKLLKVVNYLEKEIIK